MTPLDLLVIGGGITGLGVARLAARNGYTVTLVERGDLASGASSATSHMLHGGLRYLEHARFHLVHEALVERAAVARMAPALATPTRFLVPLYAGGRVGPLRLRAGLALYDWLASGAGFPPHAWLRAREALALEPDLAPHGLLCAGQYSDAVMDDARLAIAVARDAAAHGARIETYTEVTGARPLTDTPVAGPAPLEVWVRDREGREQPRVARVVVNATGPWCDEVRRRLARTLRPGAADPAPLLRPSRGIHLVYPRLTRDNGLLLTTGADGRAFFVVPFGAYSLVGTTEVEVPSPPPAEAWRADLEEVRYLRAAAQRALPGIAHEAPRALYTGVRPLLGGGTGVGQASREHLVVEHDRVVTVTGGKYTTFRVMARDTLAQVARLLGRAQALHDPVAPLPAPVEAAANVREAAAFAVAHEFATRLEDVMRRRGTRWLSPDRGRGAAREAAAVMAERLGWDEVRVREELQAYDAARWEEDALLQRAGEHA